VCSVSGNVVTLLTAGTCTIEADQAGDNTWAAAKPVQRSFKVTPATQVITFPAIPDQTLITPPFVVSASASSGLPVSLSSKTPAVCSVTGLVTLLATGTCTIEADQPGNAVYAAAKAVKVSFKVTKATQTITFGAIAEQSMTVPQLTVAASSSSGLTVSFSSSTTRICTVTKAGVVTLAHVGTCTLTAAQSGNATYLAATPVSQSFVVARGLQRITFPSIPDQKAVHKVVINATSSSGLQVRFTSLTLDVCTIAGYGPKGEGVVNLLISGTCTIEADQEGNRDYYPADPAGESFQYAGF